MDIGMILIQVQDGMAQVVRCEEDGEVARLVPAANAAELAGQAARVVAEWFNATLEQDGLYLCTNELQAAAQFPPLALPADVLTLREAGTLLFPDALPNERWGRLHALQKARQLRLYRVGTGPEVKQYVSQAAAMQLATSRAGYPPMPPARTTLRAGLAQAARVLADERRGLAERVGQARALLVAALEATAALSPAERAVLDADPTVQAALARLAAGDEVCVLAGPDGGPSDVLLETDGPEYPVRPGDFARLGL